MTPARNAWLAAHPFLEPLDRLQRAVERAAAAAPVPRRPCPDASAADRAAGTPLLATAAGPGCAEAAAQALPSAVEALADGAAGAVGEGCRALRRELRERPRLAREAVEWVAGRGAAPASAAPGLLRFLVWAALRRVLEPSLREGVRGGGGGWSWPHCPTCGALPLSAQLLGGEAGRRRVLACGCCGTRWEWRRLGCPFCGADEPDRLRVLEIEGEPGLRLDACDACGGYLKTYTGEGDEELFLADWPTLHLDVLARGRGLRRAGDSLYELPPENPQDERRSKP